MKAKPNLRCCLICISVQIYAKPVRKPCWSNCIWPVRPWRKKKSNPALSTSYPGGKKSKPRLDTPDNIQHTTDIPAYFNRNNLHFNKFHKVDEGVAMLPCLESVAAQRSCVDHLAKTLTMKSQLTKICQGCR